MAFFSLKYLYKSRVPNYFTKLTSSTPAPYHDLMLDPCIRQAGVSRRQGSGAAQTPIRHINHYLSLGSPIDADALVASRMFAA